MVAAAPSETTPSAVYTQTMDVVGSSGTSLGITFSGDVVSGLVALMKSTDSISVTQGSGYWQVTLPSDAILRANGDVVNKYWTNRSNQSVHLVQTVSGTTHTFTLDAGAKTDMTATGTGTLAAAGFNVQDISTDITMGDLPSSWKSGSGASTTAHVRLASVGDGFEALKFEWNG